MNFLLQIALAEKGVKELPGPSNNQRILHYSKVAGLDWVTSEDTSWCGIFLAYCVCQLPEFMRPEWPKEKAATARQWLNHGVYVPIEKARPGDIVIFWRESPSSWKGHVAIYLDHNELEIKCFGGNQNNSVSQTYYDRDRLLGVRRL